MKRPTKFVRFRFELVDDDLPELERETKQRDREAREKAALIALLPFLRAEKERRQREREQQ